MVMMKRGTVQSRLDAAVGEVDRLDTTTNVDLMRRASARASQLEETARQAELFGLTGQGERDRYAAAELRRVWRQ